MLNCSCSLVYSTLYFRKMGIHVPARSFTLLTQLHSLLQQRCSPKSIFYLYMVNFKCSKLERRIPSQQCISLLKLTFPSNTKYLFRKLGLLVPLLQVHFLAPSLARARQILRTVSPNDAQTSVCGVRVGEENFKRSDSQSPFQ